MKFSVEKEEKYTILRLDDEKLDSTIAPSLKSEMVTTQAEGTKNLILDLSPVKYSDSSGLSALLVGNRIFGENQGQFFLASLSDHVEKLIKISQLDNVLNIKATVQECVDAVLLSEIEQDMNSKSGDE